MTAELKTLTIVALMTGLMWIPYILNLVMVRGLANAVGYPENPAPLAPWAQRLKAAHANAVENLVVFAALILAAHATGVSNDATITCATVYLWARVVHALAYTFAIPWVRTLAFVVGVGANVCIAEQILGL